MGGGGGHREERGPMAPFWLTPQVQNVQFFFAISGTPHFSNSWILKFRNHYWFLMLKLCYSVSF